MKEKIIKADELTCELCIIGGKGCTPYINVYITNSSRSTLWLVGSITGKKKLQTIVSGIEKACKEGEK